MLQNLATRTCTRRATASLASGLPLPLSHVQRRFYPTGKNTDILKLLKECEKEEETSPKRNGYKIRSFKLAGVIIEGLDFRVQHGDDLKNVRGVGPGIRDRINVFLGHQKPEDPERTRAVRTLMTVPGLGKKNAEVLYDSGCGTVERLQLKKYKDTLSPGAKRGLKYFHHVQKPVPRENVERIVEFCKHSMPMDGYEIIIAGAYRRGAPALTEPIELLIVDEHYTDPIPSPPHPYTLPPPSACRPTRSKAPFAQYYTDNEAKAKSGLLRKIIRPLERMGVVSDTTIPAANVWQGWLRVPKKSGDVWETRRERIAGIGSLYGDFHRVNITYVPKKSKGATLLALTGDGYYYLDCRRKAVQAMLYLNEWGLWQWEHDEEALAQFQTSDAPFEKNSLGSMWAIDSDGDKGRWVHLECYEEEHILDAIGAEYVPPHKRNFGFIVGKKPKEGGPVIMKNP
ncbi:hypothetical protein BJ322DRAFT_1070619 [Thelephora terrestris]|uniref:DNA polymerase n=1 Tax=Thelephora terrestris TaxID=56493 RepID=A0A9P6HBA5_9AGAM|nr:hypothetical protein BJ322DRAFT_1070619 [Thelephora terrestris]